MLKPVIHALKRDFQFLSPDFGESWGEGNGNENDFLETQTARLYPDIKARMYEFINTGDATSVSAPGIILEPEMGN